MDKIDELVRNVRKQIQDKAGDISSGYGSMPVMEYIDCVLEPLVKQILSHPDLALIYETCYTYKETGKQLAYVIPLAEVLIRSKKTGLRGAHSMPPVTTGLDSEGSGGGN